MRRYHIRKTVTWIHSCTTVRVGLLIQALLILQVKDEFVHSSVLHRRANPGHPDKTRADCCIRWDTLAIVYAMTFSGSRQDRDRCCSGSHQHRLLNLIHVLDRDVRVSPFFEKNIVSMQTILTRGFDTTNTDQKVRAGRSRIGEGSDWF